MRCLLDENLPVQAHEFLRKSGHDVMRVRSGMKNGDVILLAAQERRILITLDKDFLDSRRYPPRDYAGIICIRVHPPVFERIAKALQRLLQIPEDKLHGAAFVLSEGGLEKAGV